LTYDGNFQPYHWKKERKNLPPKKASFTWLQMYFKRKEKEESQPIKDWRKIKEKIEKKEKIWKGSLD